MIWFYQAVNAFYLANQRTFRGNNITSDILKRFYLRLSRQVIEDEDKIALVNQYGANPLKLAQLLQSSHIAHKLERGVSFSVVEEEIVVGDESYPMREIIPLSADNQKMYGSTFSEAYNKLLAVRLNTEAKAKNEPQNFHIHPESDILSSQIAAERIKEWGEWKGFTGTISPMQAMMLYGEARTMVLHSTYKSNRSSPLA